MSLRATLAGAAACLAVGVVVALAYELPAENVVVLAPVIVIGTAAVAGLALLWGRIAWESLRRQRHPWRIVGAAVALFGLLLALTLLGVQLPRE